MPKTYVYVICTKDLRCKIGRSTKPIERLEVIQICCPCKLRLVHLIGPLEFPRAVSLEARLHCFFTNQKKQIHGEWFQLDEEDLSQLTARWPGFNQKMHLRLLKVRNRRKQKTEWSTGRRFMTKEEVRDWYKTSSLKESIEERREARKKAREI